MFCEDEITTVGKLIDELNKCDRDTPIYKGVHLIYIDEAFGLPPTVQIYIHKNN